MQYERGDALSCRIYDEATNFKAVSKEESRNYQCQELECSAQDAWIATQLVKTSKKIAE